MASGQRISQAKQILDKLTELAGVLSSDFKVDIGNFIKQSQESIELCLRIAQSHYETESSKNIVSPF